MHYQSDYRIFFLKMLIIINSAEKHYTRVVLQSVDDSHLLNSLGLVSSVALRHFPQQR